MQKFRRKKRLAGLAIAFMLTFVVGAAFAFAPGALDIVGTVNITTPENYVEWHSVDYGDGPVTPLFGVLGPDGWSQSASIEGRDGRDAQRIVWTITFDGDVIEDFNVAVITARAVNRSNEDAVITLRPQPGNAGEYYVWSDPDLAADLGLSVMDIEYAAFVGLLPAGEITDASDVLEVMVLWDGTIPEIPNPAYVLGGDEPYYLTQFELYLTIEFDYVVAP